MIQAALRSGLSAGRAQVLGLGAQLIAAAPIIVMSIYLSRSIGLAAVAEFTLLIGVSSVAFTFGMVGLRSRLLLDQFRDYSEDDYYGLRVLSTVVMAAAVVIGGMSLGASSVMTIAVVLYRIGDAALDLVMAIDQVRRQATEHWYGYLQGSTVKLVAVVLFLGAAELTESIDPVGAFAVAGLIHAVYAWAMLFGRRERNPSLAISTAVPVMLRLANHSLVFAVAQILCASLTSAPRIALSAVPDKVLAGAAGAALSVSTLIGMAYFAVWLRWAPRFAKEGIQRAILAKFAVEMGCLLGLSSLLLWLIGGRAMALVFAIRDPLLIDVALQTLLASAVFFFFMTIANVFKPSRIPWLESAVYLGGIGVIAMAYPFLNGSTPMILITGAFGMLLVTAISMVPLVKGGKVLK